MSMILDNASPIEAYGKQWQPWTREQLVRLASVLPLPEEKRLLLGLSYMMNYCISVHGVDAALFVAGSLKPAELATLIPNLADRVKLSGLLIDRMIGDFAAPAEEGDDEPADPLAVTPSTGDKSMP